MQPASSARMTVSSIVFMSSSFPRRIAESIPETFLHVLPGRCMVLRAAFGDLDRAHDCAQLPGAWPVPGARDAVEQPGPVGVAASGGIDHIVRLNARDLVASTVGQDHRALGAE